MINYVSVCTMSEKYTSEGLEIVDPISVTQPNMSMSLGDLLDRFVNGQPVKQLPGTFDLNEEGQIVNGLMSLPDLMSLDPLERIDLLREVAEDLESFYHANEAKKAEPPKDPEMDHEKEPDKVPRNDHEDD